MKKKILIVLALCFTISCGLAFESQQVMAAENPQYGGSVIMATPRSPSSFGNPLKIQGFDNTIASIALEFLVNATLAGTYESHLAKSWDVSPDGKSITFKLQKGVKFHDGTDFNAKAAKYNLDMWLKGKNPVLSDLQSVDVVDDYTVRLNFSSYSALAFYDLASECFMVSPTALEKNGAKWAETHPVGTGPYKLKQYNRGESIIFERNENYWQKGLPYLDEFEIKFIKDAMTQVAAIKSGEIDVIYEARPQHASMLEKQGYAIQNHVEVLMSLYGDSTNPDSPWSKKKFREAVEYAIDKESLTKSLGYGFIEPLYQFVPKNHPLYNPALEPRMYNPEKAKKLLAEAGYPNGLKTKLFQGPRNREVWIAVQADLAKVGVDLEVNVVDRPKYYDIRYGKGVLKQAASHCQHLVSNVIYAFKSTFVSDSGIYNDIVRPAGFDELVDKMISEVNPEKQKVLILKATKLLYENETIIPVQTDAKIEVFSKNVHGMNFTEWANPNSYLFVNTWKSKN